MNSVIIRHENEVVCIIILHLCREMFYFLSTFCSHVDLERTFPDGSHTEPQLKKPGKTVADMKGAKGLSSHPPSCPEPPRHDLTWSIREEVEKLMQDHYNSPCHTSSELSKAKKQLVRPASHVYNVNTCLCNLKELWVFLDIFFPGLI